LPVLTGNGTHMLETAARAHKAAPLCRAAAVVTFRPTGRGGASQSGNLYQTVGILSL